MRSLVSRTVLSPFYLSSRIPTIVQDIMFYATLVFEITATIIDSSTVLPLAMVRIQRTPSALSAAIPK